MATNKRADADRLPISQRIDLRMPNLKRREATPTNWQIKGELFLNCPCEIFCPCVVSLGAHPPTEGHCHAWMAIVIDEGHYEGEDLSGLNVGLLIDVPGRMGEGNWKVAAYVDENTNGKAYHGLLPIFSGAAGLFTMLVLEIIGAERAPVKIIRDGNKGAIQIGRRIAEEIEMIAGKSLVHPVIIANSKCWMGPDIIAARGLKSKVRDYGRVWEFGGKSAEICPIEWQGPKA